MGKRLSQGRKQIQRHQPSIAHGDARHSAIAKNGRQVMAEGNGIALILMLGGKVALQHWQRSRRFALPVRNGEYFRQFCHIPQRQVETLPSHGMEKMRGIAHHSQIAAYLLPRRHKLEGVARTLTATEKASGAKAEATVQLGNKFVFIYYQ